MRKVLFWIHLVVGVVSGLVIAVMSLTGTALAFEKELIAWSERDARRIPAPASGAPRVPLETLIAQVREKQNGAPPAVVTVFADATIATTFAYGRTNAYYADPYSGEIRQAHSAGMRSFMQTMFAWHRWLGRDGDQRETGKAITGACNLAFLGLAISGLCLWWPRYWTRKQLAARTLPSLRGHGKSRDWNWHNAFGFWSAPILIVLTATAIPISYRWGGDLIVWLVGSSSAGGSPGASTAPPVEISSPAPGASVLGLQTLVERAQAHTPNWEQIIYRVPAGGGRGGAAAVSPVTLAVKERGGRPRFSSLQLTLDPHTGAVLRQEGYATQDRARQIRSWTRFLHTGEALGPIWPSRRRSGFPHRRSVGLDRTRLDLAAFLRLARDAGGKNFRSRRDALTQPPRPCGSRRFRGRAKTRGGGSAASASDRATGPPGGPWR